MTYETGSYAALANLGLEKTAGPLSLLGLTGALHTGANTVFKGLRNLHGTFQHLPVGHNYETQSLAMGLRNALAGKRVNPGLSTVMSSGLGPESTVMTELGSAMGQGLRGKTPHEIKTFLKKVRRGVATAPSVRNTPLGAPMVGGINDFFSGPTKLERGFEAVGLGATPANAPRTVAQTVTPLAAAGAAAALDPHALLHFGINATRQAVAKSPMGQRMLREGFQAGLQGKPQSRLSRFLWDYGVSPAVLDTRRTGEGFRRALDNNEPGVRRLLGLAGRLAGNPETHQQLRALKNNPAVRQLMQNAAANPQAAVQVQRMLGGGAPPSSAQLADLFRTLQQSSP